MEGHAVGRALGEAAIQANPCFIDLEIGKQGMHFGFNHIQDRFGGRVVVMGEGEFHGGLIGCAYIKQGKKGLYNTQNDINHSRKWNNQNRATF